jgi:hypothetical protein
MTRRILLIAGYIASGKDTVADFLVAHQGFIKFSFADELKKLVSLKYSFDNSLCYTQAGKKSPYVLDTGEIVTIRDLLISEGKYARIYNSSIWADLLIEKILKNTNIDSKIVIPDFRYPLEYKVIKDTFSNVTTLRVTREQSSCIQMESETSLDSFNFDHLVENNASLDDLFYSLRYLDKIME